MALSQRLTSTEKGSRGRRGSRTPARMLSRLDDLAGRGSSCSCNTFHFYNQEFNGSTHVGYKSRLNANMFGGRRGNRTLTEGSPRSIRFRNGSGRQAQFIFRVPFGLPFEPSTASSVYRIKESTAPLVARRGCEQGGGERRSRTATPCRVHSSSNRGSFQTTSLSRRGRSRNRTGPFTGGLVFKSSCIPTCSHLPKKTGCPVFKSTTLLARCASNEQSALRSAATSSRSQGRPASKSM